MTKLSERRIKALTEMYETGAIRTTTAKPAYYRMCDQMALEGLFTRVWHNGVKRRYPVLESSVKGLTALREYHADKDGIDDAIEACKVRDAKIVQAHLDEESQRKARLKSRIERDNARRLDKFSELFPALSTIADDEKLRLWFAVTEEESML